MEDQDGRYFKYLREGGEAIYGTGRWPLPGEDGTPGNWMKVVGKLIPCENGLHACSAEDLPLWRGEALYVLEYDTDEEVVKRGAKVVGRRARLLYKLEKWNRRTQRDYAAECADRVLSLYEDMYPDDARPRDAIRESRNYSGGMTYNRRRGFQRAAEQASIGADFDREAVAYSIYQSENLLRRGYSAAASAAVAASMCLVHAADAAAYSAAANSAAARKAVGYSYQDERAWQTEKILKIVGGINGGR